MKKRFFIGLMGLLGLISLMACGDEPTPEAAAMASAQQSYERLLEGDYESFLAGRADAEQMPASYRQQLITTYKQFIVQHKEEHGDIASITASRAQMDSTLQLMQVFLMVCYADSTLEEVLVPMVERNGEWKMK